MSEFENEQEQPEEETDEGLVEGVTDHVERMQTAADALNSAAENLGIAIDAITPDGFAAFPVIMRLTMTAGMTSSLAEALNESNEADREALAQENPAQAIRDLTSRRQAEVERVRAEQAEQESQRADGEGVLGNVDLSQLL